MNIRILPNSQRRMAWTDRKDGYLELLFTEENVKNGYYRGNRKLLSSFAANGHSWSQAKYVDVYPEGFRANFSKFTLDVSLIIDEQALFVASAENVGLLGIGSEKLSYLVQSEDDEQKSEPAEKAKWNLSHVDGCIVLSCERGVAIAADFDFYYSENDDNIQLYVADKSSITISDKPFESKGWYIAFEDDEKSSIEKAVRLVKENAEAIHCKKVKDFLDKVKIDSGSKDFDKAVAWARFSGWLLATKDHDTNYRGIWAGLPWFRDNWGRDTFIAISGILLASGCFDEAKDVLLGFAGFQDLKEGSETYGRIPNRYRNENDVIYNTVDGTLWFVRALWEYVQYSGDEEILSQLVNTVEIGLDADMKRTDHHGFLTHGDADTWMDARIRGEEPWSARGDRANDIQALWFTALRIGAFIMNKFGKTEKANEYAAMAEKVRVSFTEYFWSKTYNAMADCLPPGGYGEWVKDMRVRPNQLFVLTVPSVLPVGKINEFISPEIYSKVLENVNRELINPFGLYSLSPEDPIFHPKHEYPEFYHKDAAYHNGTIWEWNTGAYISASASNSAFNLAENATSILKNYAKMILDWGCAGSISENIHAEPDSNGNPILSGTFSQAWSVSEFVRNIFQDVVGFVPRLAEGKICINPKLPANCKNWKATIPFGKNWELNVSIEAVNSVYECEVLWNTNNCENVPELLINELELVPNKVCKLSISQDVEVKSKKSFDIFEVPKKWITQGFEKHNLRNEWLGSIHGEDYLEKLILSKRMLSQTSGTQNAGALEWYFDSDDFKKKYLTDLDLGALYSKRKTTFRVWAPTARNVELVLFEDGTNSAEKSVIQMKRRQDKAGLGVWEVSVSGDLHGTYYQYRVHVHGIIGDSADPYAKACGVNGNRSMVVDMARTNPVDWEKVHLPVVKSPSDVIAYEAHIADVTSSPTWNGSDAVRRTYEGVVEPGTSYEGVPTGFDHICSMGVTHVQLLPIFDFRTVDETRLNDDSYAQQTKFGLFNWGYDPQNYGVPEGSYCSDPYNGEVRIRELKNLVKGFANKGIGVIQDVVFNHVKDGTYQALGMTVPGYFFRVDGYSGAGEDTASEREMFRKYMVDMLSFWLKEYKLCGFRFDLMGLHDVITMNEIRKELKKIKNDVLIYGEGWDMYRAGKMVAASMCNSKDMPGVGLFNDAIRCGIKGPVFDDFAPGFIHDGSKRETIKFGIVGATEHAQVDNTKVELTACPTAWSDNPWISVNYTEIHDNITLHDKLELVEPGKDNSYYEQMQKMAISLFMLAEGMPILHAGMEFMRTKEVPADILANDQPLYDLAWLPDNSKAFMRNSYNICDRINCLDWERCAKEQNVVQYVKDLIQLRKNHKAFRLSTSKEVQEVVRFMDNDAAKLPEKLFAWELDGTKCGDSWNKIVIIANPTDEAVPFVVPKTGKYHLITDGIEFCKDDKIVPNETSVMVKPKTVVVVAEF